jgi:outer membrane protein assembly factor BamB
MNTFGGLLCFAFSLAAERGGDMSEQLWEAARKGDAAAVKALLDKGANVNAKARYDATALHFAADKGHLEVVELLIRHKASLNARDTFYSTTPLSWAVSKGHPAVAKALIRAGATGADNVLTTAAAMDDIDLVWFILDHSKPGRPALNRAMAAAPRSALEVRDLLRNAGAEAPPRSSVTVKEEVLRQYVGTYRGKEQEFRVALEPGGLAVKSGAFTMYRLEPVDEKTFQPAGGSTLRFAFHSEGGKVTGFTRSGGAADERFDRVKERALPATSPATADAARAVKKPLNWPSFRGPFASGVADGQHPPAVWDGEEGVNVRWKTPIPGLGHSCPVVWGDRIFLTTAVSSAEAKLKPGLYGNVDSVVEKAPHAWLVLCLDKNSGKILWDKVAHEGVPQVKRHAKGTHANPTVATDGKHVIACFGSEGLYCYDFDGKQRWKQSLGVLDTGWFYDADYQWGFGSSPIIYRDLAIVQCDGSKNSFIAAYRLEDGQRAWMTPRDEIPSWGTPTIIEGSGRVELVTNGTKFARGYDPLTGQELWRLGKNSEITVPTPFQAHGLIFVASGYRPPRPVWAIKPGATGDISPPKGKKSTDQIVWSNPAAGTYMPTPIVYGEHLYTCSNDGVVTCYEAKTGKRLYWERLGSDGGFTASPVAADGRVYFTSEQGEVYVVKAGPTFELLALNRVGDVCMATPAISDGMIFVRSEHYLFGIGRAPAKAEARR